MHLVMCASSLKLPRRHPHKNLVNKLTLILFQEVRSRDVCWPSRSSISSLACSRIEVRPLLAVFFRRPFAPALSLLAVSSDSGLFFLPGLRIRSRSEVLEQGRCAPWLPQILSAVSSSLLGLRMQPPDLFPPSCAAYFGCEICVRTS